MKNMMIKILVLFVTLMLHVDLHAQAFTDSDSWSFDVGTTQVGTSANFYNNVSVDTTINVSQFNTLVDLERVVITYFRNTPFSYNADVGLQDDTGDITLDTLSVETSTGIEMEAALDGQLGVFAAGFGFGDGTKSYSDSDDQTSVNLLNANTVAFSTTSNFNEVIFDSDVNTMTTANLNSIFRGSGGFDFTIDSAAGFTFTGDPEGEILEAITSGTDAGFVQIDYYVIPEPGTLAMFGIVLGSSGLVAFFRRRKRA